MATRAKKGNGRSKVGMVMAALATAGAVSLLNTKARRKKVIAVVGKASKAAVSAVAASEVLAKAGPLLAQRRKPRSKLATWLNR